MPPVISFSPHWSQRCALWCSPSSVKGFTTKKINLKKILTILRVIDSLILIVIKTGCNSLFTPFMLLLSSLLWRSKKWYGISTFFYACSFLLLQTFFGSFYGERNNCRGKIKDFREIITFWSSFKQKFFCFKKN